MSASNWSSCPACKARAEERQRVAARRTERAYGTVPVAEYERLRAEAERPVELGATLREDYEIGVTDGGRFYVTYRCRCQEPGCWFVFRFQDEEQVDLGSILAGEEAGEESGKE
jgi:hypothetical protein